MGKNVSVMLLDQNAKTLDRRQGEKVVFKR